MNTIVRRAKLARLATLMLKQSQNAFLITPKLLDCFESIISEEEADFLIAMGTEPQSSDALLAFTDRSGAGFDNFLKELQRKGLILLRELDDGHREYEMAAIVVGWVEFVLADGKIDEQRETFTRHWNEYLEGFRLVSGTPLRGLYNGIAARGKKPTLNIRGIDFGGTGKARKRLQIDTEVKSAVQHVHPGDVILDFLHRAADRDELAVIHCFCRQWRSITEEDSCRFRHTGESCLSVGHLSRQIIEQGVGRAVSFEEAVAIIEDTRKKGAIHTLFHEHDDLEEPEVVICNCCWDCCGFLGSYNRGLAGYSCRSHYLSELARSEACILCNRCARYCPAAAIRLDDNGQMHLAAERCIGCGQCAFQCPRQVYTMVRSDRDVFLPMLQPSQTRLPSREKQ